MDLQHIVTRAEQTHNRDPELDQAIEDMAECNAHPLPCPHTSRRHTPAPITHPGPITMLEPRPWYRRVKWHWVVMAVSVLSFWGYVAIGLAHKP